MGRGIHVGACEGARDVGRSKRGDRSGNGGAGEGGGHTVAQIVSQSPT